MILWFDLTGLKPRILELEKELKAMREKCSEVEEERDEAQEAAMVAAERARVCMLP